MIKEEKQVYLNMFTFNVLHIQDTEEQHNSSTCGYGFASKTAVEEKWW